MGCLITAGKTKDCETIRKIGGVKGGVWVFNLYSADGTKLNYTELDNVVSAITVQSGEAAYKIDGSKDSHEFTTGLKKPGINRFYEQALNLRVINSTKEDLAWSDSMLMAENLVFVFENLNGKFVIAGQNNGMDPIEGDIDTTGQEAESDVSSLYAFVGKEIDNKEKILDVGTGYDDTLAYLISLETPQP